MFELSVAIKYLTPRWRQLSVSIISLISILVIALVVWLVVVFFSVTNGLTNSWIDKMIALTAPVRVTPTDDYYRSYYYTIDSVSANSDYQTRTLREKLAQDNKDPYDPSVDEELPAEWAAKDIDAAGEQKDLVKLVFSAVHNLDPKYQSPIASIYEVGSGQLRLFLEKNGRSMIEQTIFLGSYDANNTLLNQSVLPITQAGIGNFHRSVFRSNDDGLATNHAEKGADFAQAAVLDTAKLKNETLFLPNTLFNTPTSFRALGLYKDGKLTKLVIPGDDTSDDVLKRQLAGYTVESGSLTLSKDASFFPADLEIDRRVPAYLITDKVIPVKTLDGEFEVELTVQGISLQRRVPLTSLTPVKYQQKSAGSLWFDDKLPSSNHFGNPILLPKSYREAGVATGDLGTIGYSFPTASAIQEQRVPIYVAGFYDPGIIPSGGKFIIANEDLVSEIRSAQGVDDTQPQTTPSTGINIRLADREQAEAVKKDLEKQFEQLGISKYWKVETFKEFDFARDLIKQLGSEKRLFSLLAAIIIVVACSNIISMLIILVNDKKKEIGILRSMGASSISIMLIFGTCGIVMGVMGSILGTLAAAITLQNLQGLIDLISWMQGYEMFNPLFYGDTLPSKISMEAFMYVISVTAIISLLAGIIPAVKACLLKPSATLRAE